MLTTLIPAAALLALSAWPAAISDNAIGTTLNPGPGASARPRTRPNDQPPEGRMDFVGMDVSAKR